MKKAPHKRASTKRKAAKPAPVAPLGPEKAPKSPAKDESAKRGRGRPRLYQTPAEMQEKIDEYFDILATRVTTKFDEDGNETSLTNPEPASIIGLCCYLGFEDRNALQEYAKIPEFSGTIKKARSRVEANHVTRLLDGKAPAGTIFILKNDYDYADVKALDLSSKNKELKAFTEPIRTFSLPAEIKPTVGKTKKK